MDLVPRVGTFFFVIGGGALILFVLAAMSSRVDILLLLISVLCLSIGFALTRKKEPPPKSNRFEAWRRVGERNRQRREEREKNRKK